MTDPKRTPIPDAIPDGEDDHESSTVRARPSFNESAGGPLTGKNRPLSGSGEWSVAPPPSTRWLGDLVRAAKVLLADLPADHPRAQLLRVAIVRRDEILLARLIDELRGR